jgi:hypothetical protein
MHEQNKYGLERGVMNFVPNFAALNEARARAQAEQAEKSELRYQEAKEAVLARLKEKEAKCTQAIQNHYIFHGHLPASPEMFKQCHVFIGNEFISGSSAVRFKQEVVDQSDGGLKIFRREYRTSDESGLGDFHWFGSAIRTNKVIKSLISKG